ncbi:MAG: hypothetical protein PUP91_20590 [Rhizonema sp. PD37]|nr:hypothetical protein [Rhizonema sp. PD37]
MTSNSIPAEIRKLVIERASERCEYCLIHQDYEVEHIIAVKHGGERLNCLFTEAGM